MGMLPLTFCRSPCCARLNEGLVSDAGNVCVREYMCVYCFRRWVQGERAREEGASELCADGLLLVHAGGVQLSTGGRTGQDTEDAPGCGAGGAGQQEGR